MSEVPQAQAPVAIPEIRDLLTAMRREIFWSLNCAAPGIIQSFDASNQTAEIKVAAKRMVGDKAMDYPLLADCPVVILGGGSAVLTFPIRSGDTCLILFCDRSIDNWFSTGSIAPPAGQRAHSLSDAVALVGIRNLSNSIEDYDTENAVLTFEGGKLKIDTDGNVAWTAAAGAAIGLDSQVSIANETGSLKSALDLLLTALTSWTDTHGDTPNPATATALTAAKVAIDALLK